MVGLISDKAAWLIEWSVAKKRQALAPAVMSNVKGQDKELPLISSVDPSKRKQFHTATEVAFRGWLLKA